MLSKFENPAVFRASINMPNCPVGPLQALSLGASLLPELKEDFAKLE
jgi:hypothetical protein